MCPMSALAQTEAVPAPRLPGGGKNEKMEPDASVPSSFLPFLLPLPLVVYELSHHLWTMPGQAPPQVAP